MRLYIVRHGIAVDRADPAATTDEERWLTDEGKAKTRLVALGLQALGVEIDAIFSSPLVRARQTAEVLAKVLHPARRLRLTENLEPGFSLEALCDEISRAEGAQNVMLVGHEPDLGEMISTLVWGDDSGLVQMKKAGVALLALSGLPPSPRGVVLKWLLPPRALIALGKAVT